MVMECNQQFTFWKVGPQEVRVDFSGGRITTDTGLLDIRSFDKTLGIISGLAELLPDPRSPKYIIHSVEKILTQEVYQILAGYPDGNDANALRHDPLFLTLLDISPDGDDTLASGSTLNRFHYAFTRRDAQFLPEERPVLLERQDALCQRLKIANDYLVDLFVRTRRRPPTFLIVDLDPSDDPTHGRQILSGYHGYFGQHQYFPLFLFDGTTGFPLGTWLRPGTVYSGCGAVDALRAVVDKIRQAWPDMLILIRGDNGLAFPEMYEYCEAEGLLYAFGYAANPALQSRTQPWFDDLKEYYHWYGHREPRVQRFEVLEDYQAGTWSRPRRIMVKLEITPQGTNRRFLVTNMSGHPEGIYHGFYVQRGDVPESPIGELKNGLYGDRLSAHGFRSNAMKLMECTLAYALVVLYREAAAAVPEMAKAEVSTWRQRLWKVGARVVTTARRICFQFSESWPYRNLWVRVHEAVKVHVEGLLQGNLTDPRPEFITPM